MSYSMLSLKLVFVHRKLPLSVTPIFHFDNSAIQMSHPFLFSGLLFVSAPSVFSLAQLPLLPNQKESLDSHLFLSIHARIQHALPSLYFSILLFCLSHWPQNIPSSSYLALLCPSWFVPMHECMCHASAAGWVLVGSGLYISWVHARQPESCHVGVILMYQQYLFFF